MSQHQACQNIEITISSSPNKFQRTKSSRNPQIKLIKDNSTSISQDENTIKFDLWNSELDNVRNSKKFNKNSNGNDNDEPYISSEDEGSSSDFNVVKRLSCTLRAEAKFGRLDSTEKEQLNLQKRSSSHELNNLNKEKDKNVFHDDLFLTESKTNLNESIRYESS